MVEFESRYKSTPVQVKDVGSDYTRYFNPFTDSARSSYMDTSVTSWPPISKITRANSPGFISPGTNPFGTPNASVLKLLAASDAEKNVFFMDHRLGASFGEKTTLSWPLITDKEEDDDDMHMPQSDDDIRFKVKIQDHLKRQNLLSTIGLLLMIIGLGFIFIALPVLSVAGMVVYNSAYETPLEQMLGHWPKAEAWAVVNDNVYPLLQNIRSGLIDPDTPKSVMTKEGAFGDDYELVFSDEFNVNNRSFYEGDDPYWYAPDIWYGATQDLEWFEPEAVTTRDGTLTLTLEKLRNHGVDYRSGMLQSWNQLCFKGGIFEVSVSLPGPAAVMGLWPGAWTMGNLGR
jgi:beta-glucan synthesis-associated protein KRE6